MLKAAWSKILPISDEYQTIKKRLASSESINVVLSLGGGGSAEFLRGLCEGVLRNFNSSTKLRLIPILGPYIDQHELIYELVERHPQISPVNNPNGLFEVLSDADFFVGAAGTTLFEALSLNIPCLSFSVVENQSNNAIDLEAIGNTFHAGFVAIHSFPS